jgi:hypothetical protein
VYWYKQILINTDVNTCKITIGRRGKKTADWEKSIKEARVRIGL